MSMWLRVVAPQESASSAMFEELGIPHEDEGDNVEVFIRVDNVLAIASRVDEPDHCWACTADQQALPMMARYRDVAERVMKMSAERVGNPDFMELLTYMPMDAEEAELPNPPLYEHHLLLNLDRVFHVTAPEVSPPIVSVGFGAPSLHYELDVSSAKRMRQRLGLER